MNNELADVEILTPVAAAEARADFEDNWNQLNLLRGLAVFASFVALGTASVVARPRSDRDDVAATRHTV